MGPYFVIVLNFRVSCSIGFVKCFLKYKDEKETRSSKAVAVYLVIVYSIYNFTGNIHLVK